MINVVFSKNSLGDILGFEIKGHAGYSESGSDIVCAGVSAIAYTALGALDEMVKVNDFIEKNGKLKFNLPITINDEQSYIAQIILKTMYIGLLQIEEQYGEYITVKNREV